MVTRLQFVTLLVILAKGSNAHNGNDRYEDEDGYYDQDVPSKSTSQYPSPLGSKSPIIGMIRQSSFGMSGLGRPPPSMFGPMPSSTLGWPAARPSNDLMDRFNHLNNLINTLKDAHTNGLLANSKDGQKGHHVEKLRQCCNLMIITDCRDVEENERCKPNEFLKTAVRVLSFHAISEPLSGSDSSKPQNSSDDVGDEEEAGSPEAAQPSENNQKSPLPLNSGRLSYNGNESSPQGQDPTDGETTTDSRQAQEQNYNVDDPQASRPSAKSEKKFRPSYSGSFPAGNRNKSNWSKPVSNNGKNPSRSDPSKVPSRNNNNDDEDDKSVVPKPSKNIQESPESFDPFFQLFSGPNGKTSNPMGSGIMKSGYVMADEKKIQPHDYVKPLNIKKSDVEEIRQQVLEKTNLYRKYFNLPLIKLDDHMNNYAQEWANHCSQIGTCDHRPESIQLYGENLYESSRVKRIGAVAVDNWFNELQYIEEGDTEDDFSSKIQKIGHCTQMLWRPSTNMGVGVARNLSNRKFFIVANYNQRGNVIGFFKPNLPDFKPKDIEDARKADEKFINIFYKPVQYSWDPRNPQSKPTSEELQKSVENTSIGIPVALNYKPGQPSKKSNAPSAQTTRSLRNTTRGRN